MGDAPDHRGNPPLGVHPREPRGAGRHAGRTGLRARAERNAPARPLLAETIMVGHAGQGYLSFISRGVELGVEELAVPDAGAE